MLPTNIISDTHFSRARELSLPARMTGPASFVLPSATRPQLTEHHKITFDSAVEPTAFECSCEAYGFRNPCWAAARALDVLFSLAVIGVSFSWPVPESGEVEATSPEPTPAPFSVRFEHRREFKAPEEGDPDAVLVASPIVRRGKREFVRGFQI